LKFNHICGDVLVKHKKLSLYAAAIGLQKDFNALKIDSKWGSGLKPGSCGIAAGITGSFTPLKVSMIAYDMICDKSEERRFLFECVYKKRPMEILFSYTGKHLAALSDKDIFPFERDWRSERSDVCKMNLKLNLEKGLLLNCQLQGDVANPGSYAAVIRLTYEQKKEQLRFQLTACRGPDADLYFLRPLGPSTYTIRKTPREEAFYWDILYSKDIGSMELYVLLRSEGVNLGFDHEL
jgi:hypothetical protein